MTRYAILLLTLLAVTGLMFRPRQDDLWYAARVDFTWHQHETALSFMQAIVQQWHGRYSTLVLQTTLSTFEPLASMLYPAFVIISATLLLRACLAAAGVAQLVRMSPIWVAAWLLSVPDMWMSIYLLNVAVVYYTPLLVAGVAAWLMLANRPALWCLPLALIAGGFSESTALVLAWLPLVVPRFRRRFLLWWWLGLGIALVVMVYTPGAQLRASGGVQGIDGVAWGVLLWLLNPALWLGSPAGYALVFLVGYVQPVTITRRQLRNIGLVAVGAYLSVMLPVYRGNGVTSVWTLALPAALSIGLVWAAGCYASRVEYQGRVRHALTLLMLVITLALSVQLIDRAYYAYRWQLRDAAIRAGATRVMVLDAYDSLTPSVAFWWYCFEVWLGVDELIVVE